MTNLFNQLCSQIKKSNNILLIIHPNHDGDAVGSLCAFIDFLEKENKNYLALAHENISQSFNFLNKINKISIKASFSFNDFDTLIILDAPDEKRAGLKKIDFPNENKPYKIIIDHHHNLKPQADIHICDTDSSSTSEIIYDFFKHINFNYDKHTATALLCGLATDTENFSNDITQPESLKKASHLIKRGANLNLITKKIFLTKDFNSLKFLGNILSHLNYNPKHKIVSTTITSADLVNYGLKENDLDKIGTSNFLKNIKEAEIILVLKETLAGKIKGSLRSNKLNIEPLARALGGGGHTKAAGFVIEGNLIKTGDGKWKVK